LCVFFFHAGACAVEDNLKRKKIAEFAQRIIIKLLKRRRRIIRRKTGKKEKVFFQVVDKFRSRIQSGSRCM